MSESRQRNPHLSNETNESSDAQSAKCSGASVLREKNEFELAALTKDALQDEDYERAAAIRDEVERRRTNGTLNESLVEKILASTFAERTQAILAFQPESAV